MDTPEADRRATDSPSLQDSPFFSYISSLSPIEPIDAGKASLGGLTFPSPQHVFTSPHMNLPRKTNLLRRTQKPTLFGSENFAAGLADDARPHIEAAEVSRLSASLPVVQLIPCTQKERDSHDSSQDHSSSSHSCCIDEFLADPAGDSDNASASPSLCLMRAVELLWSTQGNNSNANEEVKKSDKEDHADVQHCTTSDFSEKPMSDPEGFTATVLPDAHVNKLMDLAQALEGEYIMLKEAFVEIHDPKSEKRKGSSTSLNLRPLFQAENDLLGKDTSSPKEPVESEGNLKIFDDAMEISRPSHNEQLEPLAPDHVSIVSKDVGIVEHIKDGSAINFCCHGSEDVKVHLSKGGQWQESCCTCHLQPEPIQNVKLDRNPHDDTGTKHNTSGENQNPYEQEENIQHQRVMCKRLQFEAVETHSLSIGRDENSTIGSDLEPPETLLDSENPYSTHAESVATSSSMQTNILVNHSGNAPGRLPQCSNGTPESPACMVDWPVVANGDSSMIAPRPFGIGLHLNSIGSASPMKCNTKMQSLELDMTVKGKILLPGNKASSGPKNCPASTSLKKYHSVKLITTSEKQMPCSAAENSEEKLLNSSLHYHSVFDAKPLNSSPHSDLIDSYMTPCNMNRLPADSTRSGESNQSIPRKKRKVASDNDGCKCCSCKRSKCLKLYCDCFAAGAYCTEDCACQECFNRPEYQDMVLGTRQQIESRNPLAFAPKVVIRVTESPKDNRDSKHITSTSARHKRGCSCKKSLCLKKYCECYQAGVGCSIGCRCEGCKNTYGRKDGFGDISELEHKILQKETEHKKSMEGVCYQASSDQKVEEMEVRSETINAKLCHSRFSPLTPSENDASKFLLPASYYPSPESSAPLLPSFLESSSSPRILLSSSTSTEVREGSSSQVLYDQEPECHAAAKVDSFSPRWDWFPDIHSLSPLPNPSPIASGTSSDSKKQECNILQTKLFQESGCSSGGTLHLHSSPITPLPCFGEGKFVFEPDSASEQHDIVEDDTPDVLKDNLPPIKAVKETSPNQKRVCPPHKLLHPGCSTISPGVKSGHKFILHSVPSFPPLTPCSNNAGEDAHKIGTG